MIALKDFVIHMLIYAVSAYSWIVIIYCFAGFLGQNRHAKWYVFLQELVDPPMSRIRRLSKNRLIYQNFDLTPIVFLVLLYLIEEKLLPLLLHTWGSA